MINDDDLKLLVDEVDEALIQLTIKYKIEPLSLTGVMLARMAIAAKAVNNIPDFISLLESSKETLLTELDPTAKIDKVVH